MTGRVSLLATVLFAVAAGQPPSVQAGEPVHASFSVSRSTGAAPLAVYFDSGETSHTDSSVDPFRDLSYRWTFGDSASGSGGSGAATGGRWQISGADKNVSLGPQAAHVYDSPGQYTVSLTVRDHDGNHHAAQHTITVEDPNLVFAGDATACFSTSGNFAGCPPGATHQTTDDFDAALGFATSGSRLLFRRGESWISSARATLRDGPGLIGAFGDPGLPKPDVTSTHGSAILQSLGATDWRIMDLQAVGTGSGEFFIAERSPAQHILLYRNDASQFDRTVLLHSSALDYHKVTSVHDSLFIVEGSYTDSTYGLYFTAERVAVLGVEIGRQSSHGIRTNRSSPMAMQHNHVFDAGTNGLLLKLHAGPFSNDNSTTTSRKYNERALVSDNLFTGSRAPWVIAIGPQNAESDERVRDVLIERNLFRSTAATRYNLLLWGSRLTARNNIIDMSSEPGASNRGGIQVGPRGIEGPPVDVHVDNNTCYSLGVDMDWRCIQIDLGSEGTLVRDNLLFAPNSPDFQIVNSPAATTVEANNVSAGANPFGTALPREAKDFALGAGSAAIDVGSLSPVSQSDFVGAPRPADGSGDGVSRADVGAFEYSNANWAAPGIEEYVLFGSAFGSSSGDPEYIAGADYDDSGTIGVKDFLVLAAAFVHPPE